MLTISNAILSPALDYAYPRLDILNYRSNRFRVEEIPLAFDGLVEIQKLWVGLGRYRSSG